MGGVTEVAEVADGFEAGSQSRSIEGLEGVCLVIEVSRSDTPQGCCIQKKEAAAALFSPFGCVCKLAFFADFSPRSLGQPPDADLHVQSTFLESGIGSSRDLRSVPIRCAAIEVVSSTALSF